MSLINDALKRAAQKPAPAPGSNELAAGLRPAEERPSSLPFVTLFIALVPLIALGIWFLAKGLQMDQKPQSTPVEMVVARAPEPVAPVTAPVAVAPPANPSASQQHAVLPVVSEPMFKLQGIYWRPTRPSAVVNGKTVYVGDRVGTARVTAIDQDGVTLGVNGQSKVLSVR